MASKRHSLARFPGVGAIVVSWLFACGARTENVDWDGLDSGAGGSGGASAGRGGSSGAAGKAGSVGKGGSAGTGGFAGTGGSSSCGPSGCGGCEYRGVFYEIGDSFPAGDGCNTCSCQAGGLVGCTQIACNLCSTLENDFYSTLRIAKACDPTLSVDQCQVSVIGSLYCGCSTFVNAFATDAVENLKSVEVRFRELSCAGPILCEPCAAPLRGYCSPMGRCEDVF